jgi:2',3'-cyclic-nucleotide 2'-phosphodiesterase (5'-nucleotidase family)
MKTRLLFLFLALAAGVLLFAAVHPAPLSAPAAQAAAAPAASDKVAVTILHINDTHGQTEPYTENDKSIGGYARLATLVQDARASSKASRVFLVHAGDELSRSDQLTRTTLGAANIAIWNRLGFDIWVPGNGDFYDGVGILRARIREFKGTVLAANVVVAAGNAPLARPYVIHQAGPVRIAFLGLCFLKPEEPTSALFRVADATATVKALAADLRPVRAGVLARKQADVVVAVTHQGNWSDRRMAAAVEGLDLIIGGHSHTILPTGTRIKDPGGKEVLIVQVGESMRYLGRVDLVLTKADGAWRIAESWASLTAIDDKVKLDPTMKALMANLFDKATRGAPAEAPVPASSQ